MKVDLQVLIARILALVAPKGEALTHAIAHPARDWKIVLACTFAGVLLSAAFAGFVYYRAGDANTPESTAVTRQPKVQETEIKAILTLFADRAARHAGYREGNGGFADPSR